MPARYCTLIFVTIFITVQIGTAQRFYVCERQVAHKDNSLILRIKDDCVPFNPAERRDIVDPEDITKNTGIRMIYSMAESVQYQNILGLNVLTIRV